MGDKEEELLCVDCGDWAHPYMVKDSLWEAIGNPTMLCIPCCEKRLDRALGEDDFPDGVPSNSWMVWQDGSLVPCDARTAWTILRVVSSRVGHKAMTPSKVRRVFEELRREIETARTSEE